MRCPCGGLPAAPSKPSRPTGARRSPGTADHTRPPIRVADQRGSLAAGRRRPASRRWRACDRLAAPARGARRGRNLVRNPPRVSSLTSDCPATRGIQDCRSRSHGRPGRSNGKKERHTAVPLSNHSAEAHRREIISVPIECQTLSGGRSRRFEFVPRVSDGCYTGPPSRLRERLWHRWPRFREYGGSSRAGYESCSTAPPVSQAALAHVDAAVGPLRQSPPA
jgi:hypothetical protein